MANRGAYGNTLSLTRRGEERVFFFLIRTIILPLEVFV